MLVTSSACTGLRRWHHLLVIHVNGARWTTLDLQVDPLTDDLADETVMPLERAIPFPAEGRRFLIVGELTREHVRALRTRARSLAAIHGIPVAIPATPVSKGIWFYADAAEDTFRHDVDIDIVGDPSRCLDRDTVALVQVVLDSAKKWIVVEDMVEGGHGFPAVAFDRHVSELQRADALTLTQLRLAWEEQVADARRKPDPKGKGRGEEKDEE